jgi:hypothetical protein
VSAALDRRTPLGGGDRRAGHPLGSPGMEMGQRRDPYDVILFGPAGRSVIAHY